MNYTNSEDAVLGPYVQMYPASHGSNQALNIKAEEDSDLQEEVDPVPITDQEIKVKCENYTNSEDAVLGPYVQMYPESHGSNQVLNMKVEVSDPQEEVDPVPITVQEIKVKCENYTNSEDVVLGPYVQMYPESHGSNQVLNIKVEEDSDPQEEVDPVPITFQETKVKCEANLKTHQGIHSEEWPFCCDTCNKSFSDQRFLENHQHIHTGDPFRCNVCNKPFSKKKSLNDHQYIHTGWPFYCNVCNRPFGKEKRLKKHQRMHSGERLFHCKMCNKSFNDQSRLEIHQHIHRGQPFRCKICNKSFIEQSRLENHQRIHRVRPFRCNICNKSFRKKRSLNDHQYIHNGLQFCCSVCNRSFGKEGRLKEHQRMHSGEHLFCCKMCNKSFSEQRRLENHHLAHISEPFRCYVCNESFNKKELLNAHQRAHTGEPLSCSVRNKQGQDFDDLKIFKSDP